jgi:hypothetical protein
MSDWRQGAYGDIDSTSIIGDKAKKEFEEQQKFEAHMA